MKSHVFLVLNYAGTSSMNNIDRFGLSLANAISEEVEVLVIVPNAKKVESQELKLPIKVTQCETIDEAIKYLDTFPDNRHYYCLFQGENPQLKNFVQRKMQIGNQDCYWTYFDYRNSLSNLVNQQTHFSDNLPEKSIGWIKENGIFVDLTSCEEFFRSDDLREVVVIGDAIIDEYVFCDSLGKASKDPLIVFSEIFQDTQIGGALAVAKHLLMLGNKVLLFTSYQEEHRGIFDSFRGEFSNLKIVNTGHSPATRKRRFVDRTSGQKVFESNILPDEISDSEKAIKELIGSIELLHPKTPILIMDYGHGFFNEKLRNLLLKFRDRIFVNTQSNAANRGFNPISNYKGSYAAFINGSELEIEVKVRGRPIEELITHLANQLELSELYVTDGASGLVAYSEGEVLRVPTFPTKTMDRIGAGDALLATILHLRIRSVSVPISCLFGNLAGAFMTTVIGNSNSISRAFLIREFEQLRKIVERS
jgi:sugar/nucleoside kinase (ribokinase family)